MNLYKFEIVCKRRVWTNQSYTVYAEGKTVEKATRTATVKVGKEFVREYLDEKFKFVVKSVQLVEEGWR